MLHKIPPTHMQVINCFIASLLGFILSIITMVAKRELFPSKTSVAKRLKRVERLAAANKPEMKTITWAASGALATNTLANVELTNIAQGVGINDRVGDRIRVWRVEIRGTSDPSLDHYLFQQRTTSTPTVGVFTSTIGAYLADSETNTRWTEWKHYRNLYGGGGGSDLPLKFSQKFINGIIVKYNGSTSTSVVNNGLIYTTLNRDASSRTRAVTIRVWYTDA